MVVGGWGIVCGGRHLEQSAAVAVWVRREAEVVMDLDEALQIKSVAGIEGGIVVAAEQSEGRQPDDGIRLFGQELVWDVVDSFLGIRKRNKDVGEDCRRASSSDQARGAKDVARGLLSAMRRQIASVKLVEKRRTRAGEERGGGGEATFDRVRRTHVGTPPIDGPGNDHLGDARQACKRRILGCRQLAPRKLGGKLAEWGGILLVAERGQRLGVKRLGAVLRSHKGGLEPTGLLLQAADARLAQDGEQEVGIAREEPFARPWRGGQMGVRIGGQVDLVWREVGTRPQEIAEADVQAVVAQAV